MRAAVAHAGLDDECRGRRQDEKAGHENGTADQKPADTCAGVERGTDALQDPVTSGEPTRA
ncbi:hypothetical protein ACIRLA_36585 [Streptomyces sp. NPDC102364]|uniref:hypothetical protein n=1 Tax=Streptomyces sp. NPDC102364 TaxID=3366161 RepID=UPI003828886C